MDDQIHSKIKAKSEICEQTENLKPKFTKKLIKKRISRAMLQGTTKKGKTKNDKSEIVRDSFRRINKRST